MSSVQHDQQALPRVAVLGLGTMGRGMAHSLLRAGFQVDVWNRTPEPAAQLALEGATAHELPSYAVQHADVAISMVADAAAVREVAFAGGMLGALRPGAVWAQMATIGVAAVDELNTRVGQERPDVSFVDAPVSGTKGPAESGQLLILASGPEAARPELGPVFGALGQRTKWLGGAGAGSRLKLVMNTWLVTLVEGVAEILALADSLGVAHQDVLGFLAEGNLSSPVAHVKARKMDAGDDAPEFSLQWAVKDIGLALDAADRPLPLVGLIRDRWAALADSGLGGLDVAAARHGLDKPPSPAG
ncbi:MAG TPA: NAD(P)-dependent oxidoreductase [Streptosporangiaceae bacterium]|nr:NAD(P)-dependent oxidoreductase [Streptosporangiaceae bacterium]